MKRVWITSTILFLMCVAVGFAQPSEPSAGPLSDEALAAILDQPGSGECLQPPQAALELPDQHQGIPMTCSATATCNDTSGVNVSCNFGGSGGSCTYQNQNCAAGIRGQVNCNGTITQCPQCPCGSPLCCSCEATGDCFTCCRCDGGGPAACLRECGGLP